MFCCVHLLIMSLFSVWPPTVCPDHVTYNCTCTFVSWPCLLLHYLYFFFWLLFYSFFICYHGLLFYFTPTSSCLLSYSLPSILSCFPFFSILSVSQSCLLFYFINLRTFPLILLLRDHVYSTHPLIASSNILYYIQLHEHYPWVSSILLILAPWSLHLIVSSILLYLQ